MLLYAIATLSLVAASETDLQRFEIVRRNGFWLSTAKLIESIADVNRGACEGRLRRTGGKHGKGTHSNGFV